MCVEIRCRTETDAYETVCVSTAVQHSDICSSRHAFLWSHFQRNFLGIAAASGVERRVNYFVYLTSAPERDTDVKMVATDTK